MNFATGAWLSRVIVLFLLASITLTPIRVQAYATSSRWPQGVRALNTRINTSLNQKLGLAGQQAGIEQAIQNAMLGNWNIVSWFSFTYSIGNCTNPVGNETNGCWDARNLNNMNLYALTSWNSQNQITSKAWVNFNTQFVFHLNGVEPDIYRVSLHEAGHLLNLQDNPVEIWPSNNHADSVMWYNGAKSLLYMDDKEAATMIYGIWTQFETAQFLGLQNILPFYQQGAQSYTNCGTGYPDYWTYLQNVDDIPTSPNAGRVMRFRGCAVANGSSPNFAYMPLALAEHDGIGKDAASACNGTTTCYLDVRNGMFLRWEQYNASTCTVSIDLEFTDGTTLRDSGLTDTNGVGVHPSQRQCKVPNAWFTVTIDLSPLAGKKIKRWLIAYDNPNASGTWRTYIDNLRVTY